MSRPDAGPAGAGSGGPVRTRARLTGRHRLPCGIQRLRFRLEADPGPVFRAGQYLFCITAAGERIPFSVASAPGELPDLELHWQPVPGVEDSLRMESLLAAGAFDVELGHGTALPGPRSDGWLWLVGFGSGIAPARAILRDRAARGDAVGPVLVLHGARTSAGLYLDDELRALAERDPALRYVGAAEDVDGRTLVDRLGEFLEAQPPARVILAGSYPAVRAGADALIAAGIPSDAIHSDML